ncbi:MAG: glutathione S-transferase C-terminal domain-containing protein [Myxococcota bacterium]|nr:glutathione S-transferase C-terminal domain-containing protein [Myxococcota bacterium]
MTGTKKIDAHCALESWNEVLRVFDAMERRLADGRPYLTGDRFTAADLTLASLAGPGVMPPEHLIRFPALDRFPQAAASLLREIHARPMAAYLRRMYREHPGPSPQTALA